MYSLWTELAEYISRQRAIIHNVKGRRSYIHCRLGKYDGKRKLRSTIFKYFLCIMYEVCRIIHWLPKHICYFYGEDFFWSWQ